MTAAVLTPFTAAEAVELGNRLWRKRVLPVGDVEYKGRLLHFTKDYLGQLVAAFTSRAYPQVPFQLADAQNTHTNDPERFRGEVTGMELGDDGLYVVAEVTPRRRGRCCARTRSSACPPGSWRTTPAPTASITPPRSSMSSAPWTPAFPAWGRGRRSRPPSPCRTTVIDLSASAFAGEDDATAPRP